MRILFFIITSLLILSCQAQEKSVETSNENVEQERDTSIHLNSSTSYNQVKLQAEQLRKQEARGTAFEELLLNQIIPHWYGTEWDFNGYTDVPNQGVIACGYFVSTTLKHMGINLNRYHLAQQAGLNEAKSIAIVDSNYFTVYGIDQLEQRMQAEQDGIYFVGLDNHVGYLLKRNAQLYFIHSNYIDDKVMIEKIDESAAFASNIYVVAEISTNETLMQYWHSGEVVKIYR